MVSPLLGEFVSKQLTERTAILKVRRKASEERKLTAGGGGNGGVGRGGADKRARKEKGGGRGRGQGVEE